MTGAELAAEIAEAIAQDSRLDAIREKIEAGTADLKDSEQYTAICAEITGRMMRGAVAGLDDRAESFTEIARERYRETFDIYSTVQAIVDRALGIRIAAKEPGFQEDRARKIGHALEDQTVPESTILRRAESASENFVMSQHDRCVEENAKFRDRAGLQSYAVRTGGAKCCQWCADVSGKYPANETPDGFWGRHDNCKCSILYESRRGTQLLGGTSKKWEVVAEGAGAGELHRLSGAEAAAAGAPDPVVFTREQAEAIQAEKSLTILPRNGTMKSSGTGADEGQHWFEQITTIDPSDKKTAAQLLRDFERQYAESQIEHCRVITSNGEVYDVHGGRWTVDTTLLGEKMRGSTNEHNHVTGESQYSFSWEDLKSSAEDGSKVAIAFDEKYRYTMIFPDELIDSDSVYKAYCDAVNEVGEINALSYQSGNGKRISDEDCQHEIVLRACERLGVQYERKRKT